MKVRRAEPRDADAVLALMEGLTRPAVAGDPQPQREVFLAHLGRDDAAVFVAEADGEIVGRGAARALLDACADLCRKRGCHVLVLESGHHRAEAHRLYESYGFEHYARAYSLRL